MGWDRIQWVAGVAAAMQLLFAGVEMLAWGPWFVGRAAPHWIDNVPAQELSAEAVAKIAWAKDLALNIGVYNLVVAGGLAWVAYRGRPGADSLGLFLGAGLVVIAAAAGWTGVYGACVLQGGAGLALLWAIRTATP